jgi:hypothetical protein
VQISVNASVGDDQQEWEQKDSGVKVARSVLNGSGNEPDAAV